jgi:hypothetical protein
MNSDADSATRNDYHGNRQPARNARPSDTATVGIRRISEPEVVIEIVTIGGPEGGRLQALQADAVRQVLIRLAERSRRADAHRRQEER